MRIMSRTDTEVGTELKWVQSSNGQKIARIAWIATIFGTNRSPRCDLKFEFFSNERRRHSDIVVVIVAVVVHTSTWYPLPCRSECRSLSSAIFVFREGANPHRQKLTQPKH